MTSSDLIERMTDKLFRIPIPGREKPVMVAFRPEGDAGKIEVVGSAEKLSGEWDLSEAGAGIFKALGCKQILAVTGSFHEAVVSLVGPMADDVDRQERERYGETT